MEYTKDIIFGVRYDEVNNTVKGKRQRWTSRFLHALKSHKMVTATVLSAMVFICIDVVLISNFFRLLTII